MKPLSFKPLRAVPLAILIAAGVTLEAPAQERDMPEERLGRFLGTMRYYDERGTTEPPRVEEEGPRLNFDASGRLLHFGAIPGHAFQPERIEPGQPEVTARYFVMDNLELLGLTSPNIDVQPYRTLQSASRHFVRLQQTYKGLPVFAGQMAMQLNAGMGVEYMSADISPGLEALDDQTDWTTPSISAEEAAGIVSDHVKSVSEASFTTSTPELKIFDPAVLDETGPVQLVWDLEVDSEEAPELNERWLINAKTGEVAQRYPLTHSALDREIFDSSNSTLWPGVSVRSEGDPATGVADADNAYTFIGDTYNFYLSNHARDSYNGLGATINATVRYCQSVTNCPWGNAQWTGTRMRFGAGFATDDVVGHEFAHAVTDFTSGLVYANSSGAINESLSDIWGEFIDLTNGAGTDTAGVRWDMGEDLPNGRLRSMSDPTARNDPDRLGSPLYVAPVANPNGGDDFGGVHSNSGVNNKLAFLLVDGDTFNGQTVTGMGIAPVADLYYQANANLLTSG
ncbi:MAG TPA: hypothetical protein DCY13_10230, partial [Verrucomicrobiales bacterium]|nr:hypothetical protein [Verrucomicrobiales bacterium]